MSTKYTGNFEADFNEDSPLIPEIVLESAMSDYADTAEQGAALSHFLIEKFKAVYSSNKRLGKKFAKQDNAARDLLFQFGRHWSESWLKKNYPKQYAARVPTFESNLFEFTRRAYSPFEDPIEYHESFA
jgi:hypothetical protein